MRSYEQLFRKTLLSEDDMGMQRVPGEQQTPNEQPMSDEDAWAQSNPEIADNEELQGHFNVMGLDKAEIEKYSEIIAQWGEGIDAAIKQLAQIVKFAAGEKLENAPGSEQFSSLIKVLIFLYLASMSIFNCFIKLALQLNQTLRHQQFLFYKTFLVLP